jgi:hypothetical protein
MSKRTQTPYLDQALAVHNRTAGVAPARVRALGFLREKLNERTLPQRVERRLPARSTGVSEVDRTR